MARPAKAGAGFFFAQRLMLYWIWNLCLIRSSIVMEEKKDANLRICKSKRERNGLQLLGDTSRFCVTLD